MPCPGLQHRITLLLLVALCLCACSSQPGTAPVSKRLVSDEIGRQVSVSPQPQRIISLAPSITEMLFALQMGERVVGVTSYCDFPAAAKTKEKVGDTLKPNLERLIALKPDLVLISTARPVNWKKLHSSWIS